MEQGNPATKPARDEQGEKQTQREESRNGIDEDLTRTMQKLGKPKQISETIEKSNKLVAVDLLTRKSASFQNITELSEDCPVDLRRRGSDPRSLPNSSATLSRTAEGRRRQKPWELRRSSTPIPGSLEVSSILRKALGRFSPEVGHTSVKERDEPDD